MYNCLTLPLIYTLPHRTIWRRPDIQLVDIYLTKDDLLDETTTKYHINKLIQAETARGYGTDPEINLFTACHALYDESTRKFNRKKFADEGRTTYWTKYHTDLEIILYTACGAPHDDLTWKFNRETFFDDGRTTCWMKQWWNLFTACRVAAEAYHFSCSSFLVSAVFLCRFVQ